jgi:hypothetical protein
MKSQVHSLMVLSFVVVIGLATPTFAQRRNTATGDNVPYNGGSHGPERNDTSGSQRSNARRDVGGSHGPERYDTSGSGRRNTATGDNVPYNGGSHGPERNDTSGSEGRSTPTGDNVRYNGGSHGPERYDTSGSRRPDRSAQRNSWEGLYDRTPPDRNVGNFIVSRDERLLHLQNGDRIALPTKWVWQGNAQIQVDRVYDMPLHYHVTITTKSGKTLDEQINQFIRTYGDSAAIAYGLKTAREVVTTRGAVLVWEVIKPQPLNEGETVYWRIPSAYNGTVDVQIINLRK